MPDDPQSGTLPGAPTAPGDPATAVTQASEENDFAMPDLAPSGYQLGTLLGKGGMGEVVLAHDRRIGREVAYKRIRSRDATPDAVSRFLREARIQARLDHPAIVPVYELGKDSEGRPFFTMKRLAGSTLAEKLQDPSTPQQALLRAFAEVCLAIELAHSKGFVHRDLKPSNIMLGDFGEVYVLDWGIARVLAQPDRERRNDDPTSDLDSIGEATSGGTLLGTLGFMPPEQVRGEDVGPKADVYALGAILFEILTGEPLHPRGHAAIASTFSMETASPVARAPNRAIAPELDALCGRMLRANASDRPSARSVAEHVQSYLDGDRDLEARRALSATYLANAREELASGDPQRRADALRHAARALALDQTSSAAAGLVTEIIVRLPETVSDDLRAKLDEQEVSLVKRRGERAVAGIASVLVASVLLPLFEIASWFWLGVLYASIASFMLLSWHTSRTGKIPLVALVIAMFAVTIAFSRIAGPLVLVPVVLCGTLLSVSNIPWLNDRPWTLYVGAVVMSLVPFILEWSGVLGRTTYVINGRAIAIESAILAPGGAAGLPALAVANAVFIVVVARFAVLVARDRRSAQRQLTAQAWHLGHLLPETPQVVASPRASRV